MPPEEDEEETKEVCLASSRTAHRACVQLVNQDYTDALRHQCPTLEPQVGVNIDVGFVQIFGNVTVRNYDECFNIAAALRNEGVGMCDLGHAVRDEICVRDNQ